MISPATPCPPNAASCRARGAVPDLQLSGKAGPVLLPVEIVRARTPREFRSANANSGATPSPARAFDRGNVLPVRVPAFDPTGSAVHVTARVLNRAGQPMRDIDAAAGRLDDDVAQVALHLFRLAPGPYQIEISVTNANGAATERLAFQVR